MSYRGNNQTYMQDYSPLKMHQGFRLKRFPSSVPPQTNFPRTQAVSLGICSALACELCFSCSHFSQTHSDLYSFSTLMLTKEVLYCYLCNVSCFGARQRPTWLSFEAISEGISPFNLNLSSCIFPGHSLPFRGALLCCDIPILILSPYQIVFLHLLGQVIAHCLTPSNCLRSWASSLGRLALNNLDWQLPPVRWPSGRGKVDNGKGQKMCLSARSQWKKANFARLCSIHEYKRQTCFCSYHMTLRRF